jgi:hypothetical protein
MRLHVYVNDTLYDDAVIAPSVSISKDISDRISTADLTFKIQGGLDIARWDAANWDQDVWAADVRELYDIRIEDDGGNRHFGGQISRIEFERHTSDLIFQKCNCQDYTAIIDRARVPGATFTGQTDRAIIQTLILHYAPQLTALTANIANIQTIGEIEFKDVSVREAIEQVAALTGGEWRVDYNRNLLYFVPGTYAAPFSLSSDPDDVDGVTTFGLDAFTGYTRDFIRPINSVTVLGGFLFGGVEINVTYEDPVSMLEYGKHSHTIVDRDITLASDAILRAQAMVNERAYPEESFTVTTYQDGLDVGQSLPVYHGDFQVNGTYIIRSIRLQQVSNSTTQYHIGLGAKPPDQARLLKQIEARSRRSTHVTTAIPAPGSVTDDSITGFISASKLIGTITGVNVAVDAATVVGTITGVDVVVDAGTIQGVITGGSVSVDATTIQGVIVSDQVSDELIDRLSMFAEPLRWIPEAASDPTLPDDANYPEGSFYRNTTSGVFKRNDSGTWTTVTENDAVAGKLAFYSIGSIKAGQIIGLIAAAQIGSITAGQITGQLVAAQIGSVNVSALTGTLTTSDSARINVNALQGTLTAGMGATINVGSLTGQITGSQIAALTITSANITNRTITGSKIANLTIDNTKINDLAANKITAGTITASVSMTAPTLTITSGTTTVNIDGTNYVKLTNSGTSTIAAIEPAGMSVRDTFGSARADVGKGSLTLVNSLGQSAIFSATLVSVTGSINATTGFQRNGTPGMSGTISYAKPGGGSGVITVQGGIITGAT